MKTFTRSLLQWVLCLAGCASFAPAAHAITFTTNTAISLSDTSYDGQDIVVSNCTLTVDGPHAFASLRVASGGTLTHSYWPSGSFSNLLTVANEPLTLTDTNVASLLHSNILAATIRVMDPGASVLYKNDVDYLLRDLGDGLTGLQRTTNSAIPDGGTVLVSYDVNLGTFATGLNLSISGDVELEAGSFINVNGRGYDGNLGTGRGGAAGSPVSGGGAGHGGQGGLSSSNALGGVSYGSADQPTTLGSGGGVGIDGAGGAGGGAIRLTVTGRATINGIVSANGASAVDSRSGGGAGGSIWITAQILAGGGTVSANGGNGEPVHGGGGGGGRISLTGTNSQFSGSVTAYGGAGFQRGGAGTFYRRLGTPSDLAVVTIDNNGSTGAVTPFAMAGQPVLEVRSGAVVAPATNQSVANLLVESNGWLTCPPGSMRIEMTVLSNAVFAAGSGINLRGKGFTYGQGSGAGLFYQAGANSGGGGGGHAGYGGMGAATNLARGGNYYDNVSAPALPGSGGGGNPSYPGGAGGGVLLITVGNVLHLDGSIITDGERPLASAAGGGAGGSVWLTVGTLAGAGRISVNGGSAYLPNGGGGSGGCIAVTFTTNLFSGTMAAFGGTGFQNGAAGTVYTKTNGASIGQLRVNAGGLATTNTVLPTTGSVDLTIQGGARVTALTSFRNLSLGANSVLVVSGQVATLTVSGDALIESGAVLSMDGSGYPYNQGPGPGRYYNSGSSSSGWSGGGAGHGGYGGNGFPGIQSGSTGAIGGNAYDSANWASSPGSGGGGSSTYPTYPGGAGGGFLKLNVAGLLKLDGRVSTDGLPGTGGGAGGGSGGSLVLDVGSLSGTGLLSANGGAGDSPNGGGGGGGRIVVTYQSNAFTGTITARGGVGYVGGGAGTIYLKAKSSNIPQIILDNGGLRGTNTYLNLNTSGTVDLTLRGGANPSDGNYPANFQNLFIGSNSWIFASGGYASGVSWTVLSNATIEAGGGISVDGKGYPGNQGGGAGRYYLSSSSGGGGGHGGSGGSGATGVAGGVGYGTSMTRPTTTGSGGGKDGNYSPAIESAGGGGFRLTVNGLLELDGTISANGLPGLVRGAGGGAGGSVLLDVRTLTGSGVISADGGAGDLPAGGGGGGGRIAVYWGRPAGSSPGSNSFAGTISAKGGAGFLAGGAGTIYMTGAGKLGNQLLADNGGQRGTNTLVTSLSYSDDLRVAGGAVVVSSQPLTFWSLDVLTNSAVLVSNQTLTVAGDATIQAGAALLADGLGYGPAAGPGAGNNLESPKGGGSHGGIGGANITVVGSGSIQSPTTWGSGGGNASGSTVAPYGGSGGGAVNLNVTGKLTVDGRISANGNPGGLNSGGGAGGSVWLTVGTLAGTGAISANGGDGNGTAGGGGGGRVAIAYKTNSFNSLVTAFGGPGSVAGGAGTVYWQQTGATNKWLVVNNGGFSGAGTPLTGLTSGLDLAVANGALAYPQSTFPLFNSVTVGDDGFITSLANQTPLELAALGNITIERGGGLKVDARGFVHGAGPGAGELLSGQGGGGGYGGMGGASASGALGGATYGSGTQPQDQGSGGGATANGGSDGGGAIRLSVGGTLNLGGLLSANGSPGWQDDAGGGSGGSLWVRARELTGDGVISADGGDGEWFNGGGGGGGRIAVYSPANTFTGLLSVIGGLGANAGQAGTVFMSTNLPGFDIVTHSPAGVVSNVVSSVDFTFSDLVNPSSISAEDIVVITPSGILPPTNLSASAFGLFTLHVTFPIQNQPGDYAVLVGPEIEGLFAQPMSQVYTGAFTVTLPTISGSVTNGAGQGVPDVTLQPDGGLPATMTDTAGHYSIGVPPGWNGNVVPALGSLVFVPGTRSYANLTDSVTNENYLMVETIAPELSPVTAGTNLWLNWTGVPGVSYQVWSSTNLADWYPWGEAMPGTNGPMEMPLPTPDQPMQFFRLQADN